MHLFLTYLGWVIFAAKVSTADGGEKCSPALWLPEYRDRHTRGEVWCLQLRNNCKYHRVYFSPKKELKLEFQKNPLYIFISRKQLSQRMNKQIEIILEILTLSFTATDRKYTEKIAIIALQQYLWQCPTIITLKHIKFIIKLQ